MYNRAFPCCPGSGAFSPGFPSGGPFSGAGEDVRGGETGRGAAISQGEQRVRSGGKGEGIGFPSWAKRGKGGTPGTRRRKGGRYGGFPHGRFAPRKGTPGNRGTPENFPGSARGRSQYGGSQDESRRDRGRETRAETGRTVRSCGSAGLSRIRCFRRFCRIGKKREMR